MKQNKAAVTNQKFWYELMSNLGLCVLVVVVVVEGHCVYYIARCAWRSDWLRLESECLNGEAWQCLVMCGLSVGKFRESVVRDVCGCCE